MAKVKLLLLVTQSVWGGAQKYVHDLATNLPQSYDITVAAGSGGELLKKLQKTGVKTWEIPELVRPVNLISDAKAFLKIYHRLKKERFHIVHASSSKAGVIGRLAAKIAGVKAVTYTIHGLVLNEPLSTPIKFLYWTMEWLGSRVSGKMIAVSEKDRASADQYLLKSKSRITVIPIGVRNSNLKAVPHRGIVIGTVANFYPTKGYRYYLPSIKLILKKYPKVRFELVGTGGEEKWVREQVERIKQVKIITDATEGRERLAKFDIFVLPSVKEGMPYTIVEAMQAGLPVVATKVGGVPEQIEDEQTGLLVPSRDPQALVDAVSRLIDNPKLREKLGQKAKKTAGDKFSLARMVAATDRFYKSIL